MKSSKTSARTTCLAIVGDSRSGKTTLWNALSHSMSRTPTIPTQALFAQSTSKELCVTRLVVHDSLRSTSTHVDLIDTPGSVVFGGEVEAALSLADAALVVVDCLDGVGIQCERILRRVIERRLQMLLFINNAEAAVDPTEACQRIISRQRNNSINRSRASECGS